MSTVNNIMQEIVRQKATFEFGGPEDRTAKEIAVGGIYLELVIEFVNDRLAHRVEMHVTRQMLERGENAKLFGLNLVICEGDILEVR